MTILEDPIRPFDPSRLELVETEPETDGRGEGPEPLGDLGRSSDRDAEGLATGSPLHDEPGCAGI